MNKLLNWCAAGLLTVPLCSTVFAEEQQPQPASGQGHGSMGGMMQGIDGMMGGTDESMDQRVRQQQEHQLKMHDLMHQITSAKDEKERERLKEEQRNLMKEKMKSHQQKMQKHMQQMM